MKKYFLLVVSLLGSSLIACSPTTPNGSSLSVEQPSEAIKYEETLYSNPLSVKQDGHNYSREIADTTIVDGENGYYYIVSTERKMLRSENLVDWEVISENMISTPTWGSELYPNPGPKYVWAPDLKKINDTWILYYSLSGTDQPYGVGYATADDVEGPYVDQGKLFDYQEIGIENAIDPQIYIEDDGLIYMVVGSYRGVFLIELEEDGQSLYGGVEYQNENKVLIAGREGRWDATTFEGGYITKKDDTYYFFGSSGLSCEKEQSDYKVHVGKSDSLFGPYVDSKGKKLTGGTYYSSTIGELVLISPSNKKIVGPGHNSIFIDDAGDYWIYYHAYYEYDNYNTRHLFMDKLEWNEQGFPYVNTKRPSFETELAGPRMFLEE